jgi:hypothetical protein
MIKTIYPDPDDDNRNDSDTDDKVFHGTYLEVHALSDASIDEIIDRLLTLDNRTLVPSQKQLFRQKLFSSRMPLYACTLWRLIISKLSSIQLVVSADGETPVSETLIGLMESFLDGLERRLGRAFVSKALGYITAARQGLSFMELADVLSCDEDVMSEVFPGATQPAIRRVPPVFLTRLFEELDGCFCERRFYGVAAYFWYVV